MTSTKKFRLLFLLGIFALSSCEVDPLSFESFGCEQVFIILEEQATFKGGDLALNQFFADNIVYPQEAIDNEIEGRVIIKFVIDKQGVVHSPIVLRDIGGGCGAETIRVANMMPDWNPGLSRGEPECMWITIPVEFKL